MTTVQPPIPRLAYALPMGVASTLAVGVGLLAASAAGASPDAMVSIGLGLALVTATMAVPLMGPPLVTPANWGLVVMGVSMGRTLLAMGAMMALTQFQGLPAKPAVYGLLLGAVLMMGAEAIIAARVIARMDRDRKNLKASTPPAGVQPAAGAGSTT